jgi:hypothetical protein
VEKTLAFLLKDAANFLRCPTRRAYATVSAIKTTSPKVTWRFGMSERRNSPIACRADTTRKHSTPQRQKSATAAVKAIGTIRATVATALKVQAPMRRSCRAVCISEVVSSGAAFHLPLPASLAACGKRARVNPSAMAIRSGQPRGRGSF